MKQAARWLAIFIVAEGSAAQLAVAFPYDSILHVFWGLNLAYGAAFLIVMDHEARGRGE